ncbi:MAG: phosphonate metabolism protein/1,5-bisphosphokinase (PRPP-forming) PhnN [Proteobacteria bacterium]|nr:phosphonate metabolism protein/1,5-bisphosphokinase (PRPP-forming) PhnN [Pseudomonadota bacterium]
MGPSGAGKDSVLAQARLLLAADMPVVFAHRYITRPAGTGGENHIALTRAEFARRRAHGLLAFHWHAHGNDYGIGCEIQAWRDAGLTVVVSGSREHFQSMDDIDEDLCPVLITAPPAALAERLAARGREDKAAVLARLERGTAYAVNDRRLVTIANDGPLDHAARALVSLLATLRSSPDGRRQA